MKRFKCLVKSCGHVVRTRTGIGMHIKGKHQREAVAGKSYDTTSDPVSNPNLNGPKRVKRRVVEPPIISAGTRFIDVPCVLRISVGGLKLQRISSVG